MLAAVYHPGNDILVLEKNYPIRELEDHEVLLKFATADGTVPPAPIPAVIGVGGDGAYAQYLITTADALVLVPDVVSAAVAAIVSDAGIGDLRRDFKPAARELALELGATEAFGLIELASKAAAGLTVNTTIDLITNSQTFNLAMVTLKGNEVNFSSSPSLVLVGFSAADILTSGVQIRSSSYGAGCRC
ncbi:hypothetical protein C8R44DRAFT_885015 [Mycena epipterygia]|nr:hypothetical protein C8R44DRAFT_885015 [Mycena epipterygia]